ncbi:hypothetical protein C5E22_22275 [Pectobacterium parmentieri]|uniref:hypothetical protein n=1 Tax=Pectobacterium parmentieri TaxID=1905730 RepID=UPI000EACEDC3|nr:hypothetical protein [Pectobacterium parmentieri]AYH08224.1 hypothetical protein C5E25_21620 [Pectobacterium parmentieri]AYH21420.1 hypothetical protein C5E22_22275 [Pectobacterium parmentieri]AYH25673.1 hypothetical protein C5E21_21245 [Pectobacterium parmentieri]MBN3177334.1 hypothetical protein [Pectobacterium parmentieri]QRN29834.1 hypothetical protein IG623_21735 [Pectobacterium parmentieri]
MKKDEQFVDGIFKEIFNDNLPHYEKTINENKTNGNDAYRKISITLSSLDEEEKKSVFDFFKIVSIDTASLILRAIDGTHFPPGIDNDFKLISDEDEIQGDLQDIFLGAVEDKGIF